MASQATPPDPPAPCPPITIPKSPSSSPLVGRIPSSGSTGLTPAEFLGSVFADPATVQQVLERLRPETMADLRLAATEDELQSWLPGLVRPQVRRLWRAVNDIAPQTPLTEGRLPSEGADNAPELDPGIVVDLWPRKRRHAGLMVEKAHFFRPRLLWVDLSAELLDTRPEAWHSEFTEYLDELAGVFRLHPASVKDCLTPGELPKVEFTKGVAFCVTRYCADRQGVSFKTKPVDVRDVSSKFILIITTHPTYDQVDVVITIHLHALRGAIPSSHFKGYFELQAEPPGATLTKDHLVNVLLDDVLDTYAAAILRLRPVVDEYERCVALSGSRDLTGELYAVRRRVSAYKRLLQCTQDMLQRYVKQVHQQRGHDPFAQDLLDLAKSLLFDIDDVYEGVTELLNLHMSLIDHHSNRLLYALTILTVLFTPITFISSLYGMNFDGMPELHWQYGYAYCWGLFGAVVLATLAGLIRYGFISFGRHHTMPNLN